MAGVQSRLSPFHERLLIQVPERQVEPGQVVVDEDAALEERQGQRQQQRGAANQDE